MGLAAIKGEPTTTLKLAESGNKSAIVYHKVGVGLLRLWNFIGESVRCSALRHYNYCRKS